MFAESDHQVKFMFLLCLLFLLLWILLMCASLCISFCRFPWWLWMRCMEICRWWRETVTGMTPIPVHPTPQPLSSSCVSPRSRGPLLTWRKFYITFSLFVYFLCDFDTFNWIPPSWWENFSCENESNAPKLNQVLWRSWGWEMVKPVPQRKAENAKHNSEHGT